ncbi:MAG: glycine cleavage system aminomethyltransferase GcvT [Gammaproteobacteria bacterium]|nr:glycine cleavage system aminomethyltransferase GcvT [Gammaproteobacteria bacterium]
MAKRTPLFDLHISGEAKMLDFCGWEMPLHYGSQLHEHAQVRQGAGVFDVSHMTLLEVKGLEARAFLRYVLANDVARLQPGQSLYSCILSKTGGILDGVVVYDRGEAGYIVVANAGTHDKTIAWLNQQIRGFEADLRERLDVAILAVQGPQAVALLGEALGSDTGQQVQALRPFQFLDEQDRIISRTGYTGEDGIEIILPATAVTASWERLLNAGIQPCGLGARDSLRLEAGLNLYGNEMDESTSPLVCGLGWSVAWEPTDRKFIGRSALEKQRQDKVKTVQIGLVLEERGMLRARQRVVAPSGATGIVTSGTFSPTLGRAIGLARVPADIGAYCQVDVRSRYCPALVVKPPFVRHGHCLIGLPSAPPV